MLFTRDIFPERSDGLMQLTLIESFDIFNTKEANLIQAMHDFLDNFFFRQSPVDCFYLDCILLFQLF